MEKSGYDFNSTSSLRIVSERKPYGPNDQLKKKMHRQGGGLVTPRVGFGYMSSQPVNFRIGARTSGHSHGTLRLKKLKMIRVIMPRQLKVINV